MRIGVRIAGLGGQLGRIEVARLRERILARRLRRLGNASRPAAGHSSDGGTGIIRRSRSRSRRPVE
ncbi:MAG: hypothetical protein KJ587_17080 [Alphaproteobacteria bacterium]|nr:hypothetical protein [Alphaproteobacteria bacterium]